MPRSFLITNKRYKPDEAPPTGEQGNLPSPVHDNDRLCQSEHGAELQLEPEVVELGSSHGCKDDPRRAPKWRLAVSPTGPNVAAPPARDTAMAAAQQPGTSPPHHVMPLPARDALTPPLKPTVAPPTRYDVRSPSVTTPASRHAVMSPPATPSRIASPSAPTPCLPRAPPYYDVIAGVPRYDRTVAFAPIPADRFSTVSELSPTRADFPPAGRPGDHSPPSTPGHSPDVAIGTSLGLPYFPVFSPPLAARPSPTEHYMSGGGGGGVGSIGMGILGDTAQLLRSMTLERDAFTGKDSFREDRCSGSPPESPGCPGRCHQDNILSSDLSGGDPDDRVSSGRVPVGHGLHQLDYRLNALVEHAWSDLGVVAGEAPGDGLECHVCPDCGKQYSTSSNLARHRQTHRSLQDKKARKCPHCDKVYVSMPAYSMHVRTHNQGCECPYCGKRFSRPWLLQGHIRTHTGEKPFKCQQCLKSFADKSNLRAHVQTHSSDKPYICGRCGKAFALKSYLYKHEESSCMRGQRLNRPYSRTH